MKVKIKREKIMRICAGICAASFILVLSVTSYSYGIFSYLNVHGASRIIDNDPSVTSSYRPWTLEPTTPTTTPTTITPAPGGSTDPNQTPGTNPTESNIPTLPPDYQNMVFNNDLYTVLFIGVDTDEERKAQNKGYNADTLILISLDVKTNKTYLISIPRDTKAIINKVNSKGQITGERTDKINAAFGYGLGMDKYGCENTCAAVERLLEVPVRKYVAIDMDGIAPLTDAIGGVELVIDADFSAWGMPKGSLQLLDGEKAYRYVRTRKDVGTGGSDIARTKRQLRFVNAYLQKVKQLNPVTTYWYNRHLIDKYVHTNISNEDMYVYAQLLINADFEDSFSVSLPGSGDGFYWILNRNELAAIRNHVFFKNPE
ncbi:MAG TPA: LCP family protein [Clostridia bacterium]|nr:LCP family protein [Clostridia bacterium]